MNVRGWKQDIDSDNFNLRSTCVLKSDIDILGIAESHLTGHNNLDLDGFRWFRNNRKLIHRSARNGSGGVGFFICNTMLLDFDVKVLFVLIVV